MTRRDAIALIRACLAREERPTVEIARNSRGTTFTVRATGRSVKDAGRRAAMEYDRLAKKYPREWG